MKLFKTISALLLSLTFVFFANAQQTWFVDGYHGGVYGHYPQWQARFMVDSLTNNPDWKICLEIEPETWDSVSVRDAANFRDLQEYFAKTGRFGRIEFTNPTWSQPYCYNISGESLIRQFSYGIAKVKEYFPDATFDTYAVEEPCFTSALPQILKGFGFKYGVLRNPNTCWGGYTTAHGKDLVTWVGPDGTSLPAVPRYGVEWLSDRNCFATASANHSDAFIKACFEDGIEYPVGMCFQDAGWKGGPWLGSLVRNYYKPTDFILWTDYIDMVKDKVEAPEWAFSVEDVKPGLVWGAQILQKLAQECRESEKRLVMAEKMAALNALYSGTAWPSSDFAEAWRTLMLAQHHDCWIVPYNGQGGKGLNWADNVTLWTDSSNRIAGNIIGELFEAPGENASSIRVFNTLGTPRSEMVLAALPKSMDSQTIGIFDMNGKQVPSQVSTGEDGSQLLLFEAMVPGAGYSTYSLKQAKPLASKAAAKVQRDGKVKVETDYYTAIFDPSQGGAITSLKDKKNSKRELIETGKALNNMRGYFYQEEKFHESKDNTAKVSIQEDGALFTTIRVENTIAGSPYYQLITFNKRHARIDFELHIDWVGQPGIGAYDQSRNYDGDERAKAFYNDNYKLHIQFPLAGVGERLFKNAPFDVYESQLDNTIYSSWDSIKHNVILNWVDVENQRGDYGVALFSDHTTSYLQTEELPLGLTVQYVGRALWGRQYKLDGPTHMKYSLLPHSGGWEQAGLEAQSAKWNEPLIAGIVSTGEESAQHSLLSYSDANLHLSSVNIDGSDMIIRFYSSSSSPNHEISWNCTADSVAEVDLYGQTIADVKTGKGEKGELITKLEIPRFGLRTLRFSNVKIIK